MRAHHVEGGEQHSHVIGKAQAENEVRHHVDRQDEIGESADQYALGAQRRCLVEGAIIGGDQVLGIGDIGQNASQLGEEFLLHRLFVTGENHRTTPPQSPSPAQSPQRC